MPEVTRIPRQIPLDAEQRLRRLRHLSWILDRSFGVGPRARFGLDPLIGLIPGLGDWAGASLSLYIVYEATRLGVPWSVVGRMLGNIAVESVVGSVPLAGDVFDFFWQANTRNLQLVDRHYRPQLKPRPIRSVAAVFVVIILVFIALLLGALLVFAWIVRELWQILFA